MTEITAALCPQCQCDLQALFGEEAAKNLIFCPQCQFPLALIANKYRLEKQIGEGGFGKVYLARHVQLQRDRERVIKILNAEIFKTPGMEARFYREVQVTGSVARNNDHIVRIYDDFGKHPQLGHFYVMEYLEGQPLSQLLKPQGTQIPLSFAAHVFKQLCEAIDTAHQEQVIHRDLKPENIFLIKRKQEDAFVKVLDFGIAKPLDAPSLVETQLTHGALGTPLYMAPEQWANAPIDGRIDIYAMGLLLYQMLAGCLPFPGDQSSMSMQDLVAAHLHHAPQPLAITAPDLILPDGLEDAIFVALRKDPSERYNTAKAFWKAIEALGITGEKDNRPTLASLTAQRYIPLPQMGTANFADAEQATAFTPMPSSLPPSSGRVTPLPTIDSQELSPEDLASLRQIQRELPTGEENIPKGVPAAIWLGISLTTCVLIAAVLLWWLKTSPNQQNANQQNANQQTNVVRKVPAARQKAQKRPIRRAPRPKPPTIAPLCPPNSTKQRWLYLALPTYKGLKITDTEDEPLPKVMQVKAGRCIGLTNTISIKLTADKHSPCYFPVAFQRATLHIQLKQSSFDALDPAPNYCIKRK